jgi:hypothetical protein
MNGWWQADQVSIHVYIYAAQSKRKAGLKVAITVIIWAWGEGSQDGELVKLLLVVKKKKV